MTSYPTVRCQEHCAGVLAVVATRLYALSVDTVTRSTVVKVPTCTSLLRLNTGGLKLFENENFKKQLHWTFNSYFNYTLNLPCVQAAVEESATVVLPYHALAR